LFSLSVKSYSPRLNNIPVQAYKTSGMTFFLNKKEDFIIRTILIAPAPLDHLCNEHCPARLMACPKAFAGITVVILIEVYKVLEMGVQLVCAVFAMNGPSALVIFCKNGRHSPGKLYGNLQEVHVVP
jgi:hypothetical protein